MNIDAGNFTAYFGIKVQFMTFSILLTESLSIINLLLNPSNPFISLEEYIYKYCMNAVHRVGIIRLES